MSEIVFSPAPNPNPVLRFEITLQKQVIVYAPTEEEARARVKSSGVAIGMTVTSITQIETDKCHGPTVDLPPKPPPHLTQRG
jgi:hypothetical protein